MARQTRITRSAGPLETVLRNLRAGSGAAEQSPAGRARLAAAALVLTCSLAPALAAAAPALRYQVDQHGDFVVLGNTLGHDCGVTGHVVVGTVDACGSRTADDSIDVLWRSDPGTAQTALADTSITADTAGSTAVLQIPAGAAVTYARLYWASTMTTSTVDGAVTLARPGGTSQDVVADATFPIVYVSTGSDTAWYYQASADVTSFVQAQGPGPFRVSGVAVRNVNNLTSYYPMSAWTMVVFYALPADPIRNLALFDGFDVVSMGNNASATLSGFLVPNAGYRAKLGVIAYEGDQTRAGDQFLFNGTALSDGSAGSTTNFFNGSRLTLGASGYLAGDLPQLDGLPGGNAGFDLDVVDVTSLVSPGDTSAAIQATSSQDTYVLGAFVTSISTLKPNFIDTVKTVTDVPADGAILAGDTLRYAITATNTGTDASVDTIVRDPLPLGVTFVPGSVTFSGDNGGYDFDAGTRTLTARVGMGATSTQGGSIAIGESFTVAFDATIDAGTSGTLLNGAVVSAAGLNGDPTTEFPSHDPDGSPGTAAPVDACAGDGHCGGATPACDVAATPNACVACTSDAYCSGATPLCDLATRKCVALTTIAPASRERTTVVETAAPFAMTLTSHFSSAEIYDLDVAAPGCDLDVEIRDGLGALVATKAAGGSWSIVAGNENGNGLPDLGPTGANGGTTAFELRLVPRAGMPVGSACTATLTALGATSLLQAQASATLHVGEAVTFTPDHAGAGAMVVPSGGVVNFPGVVQNNGALAQSFPLAASVATVPDAGSLAPVVFYTDPNGDGDPADGLPVVETGSIEAFGGTARLIVQVRATTATGTPLAVGTAISVSATAGSASQLDEAVVGYLSTYADPARAISTRTFAPCTAAYAKASRLPAGSTYALEWYDRASPVRGPDTPVRVVDPLAVAGGQALDELALGAVGSGTWTLLLVQHSGGGDVVLDSLPIAVEAAGAFGSLAAGARVALGAPLEVSASVTSQNGAATLRATRLSYAVGDGTSFMDGTGAFVADPGARTHLTAGLDVAPGATAADAFTILAPAWPALGRYRIDAEWQLSCGATPSIAGATLDIDVVPPAPVVDTPAAGATLATTTPTFGGSARPGASVAILVDGASLGPVTADGAGRFTYTLAAGEALGQGPHSVVATQTEGPVTSDPSAPVSFTVDTLPPLAPSLAHPVDGGATNVVNVAVDGEAADPDAVHVEVVEIVAGSPIPVGTFDVAGGTTRGFSGTVTLAAGAHELRARALDAAGNASAYSASVRVTIDLVAPLPAAGLRPADGDLLGFAQAGSGVDATGSAEEGATVHVTLADADTSVVLLEADAARAGTTFRAPLGVLADGRYRLTATVRDLAGNESAPTAVAFAVDTTVAPPAFTAPSAGATLKGSDAPGGTVTVSGTAEPAAALAVTVGSATRNLAADASTGAWSTTFDLGDTGERTAILAEATQTDPAGNASLPGFLSFELDTRTLAPAVSSPVANATMNLAATPDGVVVTGTAEAGAAVTVAIGASQQTATAASGSWSFTFAGLPDGPYQIVATAADAAGNPAAQTVVPFSLDRTPPSGATLTSPSGGPTNATSVVVAGTAPVGETVVLLLDGVEVKTASPDANGDFSTAVDLPAGPGPLTVRLTAKVRDAARNDSTPSEPIALDIDRSAPPAPILDSPAEGAAFAPGPVEVRGRAEAGARVSVSVAGSGSPVEAIAGADGSFTATISVPEGTQTIAAVATDAAGNASPATQVTVTARTTSDSGGSGCGCGQGSAAPSALAVLALVALAPRRRRP